ncbi:carbamoyltransferase C-terminal domain-containing protein [Halovenus rubra]|uniref:Carbamoyltransferase C-terminal domain-containing protein n=2 Tax=Halovenus rubra TaxID=869890 RepID=A0ACC7DX79_9EURY
MQDGPSQTVREEQNTRYYRLISEFDSITGVWVLLNMSFNDHGEPIVTTPTDPIKDFYREAGRVPRGLTPRQSTGWVLMCS